MQIYSYGLSSWHWGREPFFIAIFTPSEEPDRCPWVSASLGGRGGGRWFEGRGGGRWLLAMRGSRRVGRVRRFGELPSTPVPSRADGLARPNRPATPPGRRSIRPSSPASWQGKRRRPGGDGGGCRTATRPRGRINPLAVRFARRSEGPSGNGRRPRSEMP